MAYTATATLLSGITYKIEVWDTMVYSYYVYSVIQSQAQLDNANLALTNANIDKTAYQTEQTHCQGIEDDIDTGTLLPETDGTTFIVQGSSGNWFATTRELNLSCRDSAAESVSNLDSHTIPSLQDSVDLHTAIRASLP